MSLFRRVSFFFFAFTLPLAMAKKPVAPVNRISPPTRTVIARPAAVSQDSFAVDPAPARFRVAPALGILSEAVGFGGLAELSFSTGSPLYVGIEAGYLQWNADSLVSGKTQMTLIPVLATFIYRFDLKRGAVHPYLGAAMGVSLTRGDLENPDADIDAASVETQFLGLARPGVEFDFSRTTSFFIEPQFGVLGSEFIFVPQMGLAFSF
jgi:hypothetical protein